MVLLGLLPLIGLFLISLVVHATGKEHRGTSLLLAAVIWGVIIVIISEILSALHLILPIAMLVSWLAVIGILLVLLLQQKSPVSLNPIVQNLLAILREEPLISALAGIVILITLVIALVSPPNYWDVMVYHMPRVMHWIQNRTIEHYPTSISSQLYMPPFGNLVMLHFHVLTGSDRYSNLVQWLSMLGSLIAIYHMAGQLGAGRRSQMIAVLWAATIPAGIIEAASAEVDYVVTLWLACFVHFLLKDIQETYPRYWVGAGLSLGLALLTKQTAYFFAIPFILWYASVKLRANRLAALRIGAVIGLLALVLNAPHYNRNMKWFGSPFADPKEESSNRNDRFGMGVTFSNVLRNGAAQLTLIRSINRYTEAGIREIHQVLNLNADDPATSSEYPYRIPSILNTSEASSGNLIHFLTGSATLLLVLVTSYQNKRQAVIYALLLMLGFVIYNAYIKWSPFRLRIQLPLYILIAPLVGLVIVRYIQNQTILRLGSIALVLSVIPFLLSVKDRPLLPIWPFASGSSILITDREMQYFTMLPGWYEDYVSAVDLLINQSDCHTFGLVTGDHDLEYPVWIMLRNTGEEFRILHSEGDFETSPEEACALIFVDDGVPKLNEEVLIAEDATIYEWETLALALK